MDSVEDRVVPRLVEGDPEDSLTYVSTHDSVGVFEPERSRLGGRPAAAVGEPARIHPMVERDHRCGTRLVQGGDEIAVVDELGLVDHAGFGVDACLLGAEPEGVYAHLGGETDVVPVAVPEVGRVAVYVWDQEVLLVGIA